MCLANRRRIEFMSGEPGLAFVSSRAACLDEIGSACYARPRISGWKGHSSPMHERHNWYPWRHAARPRQPCAADANGA